MTKRILGSNWLRDIQNNFDASSEHVGETFFVDPRSGDDDRSGKSKAEALLTLQAAIDLCVDRRMDKIIVLNGTQVLTTSVLFNKWGISVFAEECGMPENRKGERFMVYGPDDEPAAVISQPCHIRGLGFSTAGYTGAGSHNVRIDSTGFDGWIGGYNLIENCKFTTWGVSPDYGLYLKGCTNSQFIGNSFDGAFNGFTDAAIGIGDVSGTQVYTCDFVGNIFRGLKTGNYAFEVMSGSHPQSVLIADNYLLGDPNTEGDGHPGVGKFLNHLGGTVYGVMLANNWIPLATDTGAYSDTVDNLQTAGYQFAGNNYAE